MKERPILFSAPMVRAIWRGEKTQTRRGITRLAGFGKIREFQATSTPGYDWIFRVRGGCWNDLHHNNVMRCCPYGIPGDRLWVRETWGLWNTPTSDGPDGATVLYRANHWIGEGPPDQFWRPSIHMPRWASRIDLEIVSVRIERLLDISEFDARAEGVASREAFLKLWEEINGKGTAALNPLVWVVEFRRVSREEVAP